MIGPPMMPFDVGEGVVKMATINQLMAQKVLSQKVAFEIWDISIVISYFVCQKSNNCKINKG